VISLSPEKEYSKESKSQGPAPAYRCPECKSANIIRDYYEAQDVCGDCGLVLREGMLDRGYEKRVFDEDQRNKKSRTGLPTTYTIHDKGLSTMIDWHDRDVYGTNLKPGQREQFYRLRKWQKRLRVSNPSEKSLSVALDEINRTSDNLNLPKSAWENASVIYRKALEKGLIKGRSIQGMAAASVYLSCRQHGLSKTVREIAQASYLSKKKVSKSYRFLLKELDYKIPIQEPSKYVTKFSNKMEYQGIAEEIATKIIAGARELKLTSGKDPTGIAAASSYIALTLIGEKKTQKEISEIAQVTEVTVRNRYKELIERLLIKTTQ
jgi:transcription initiation factor TFIIB